MSRENDTPETDEPRPECLSMAKAIEGDGPIALTTREADALRSAITMMLKELTELRGLIPRWRSGSTESGCRSCTTSTTMVRLALTCNRHRLMMRRARCTEGEICKGVRTRTRS